MSYFTCERCGRSYYYWAVPENNVLGSDNVCPICKIEDLEKIEEEAEKHG